MINGRTSCRTGDANTQTPVFTATAIHYQYELLDNSFLTDVFLRLYLYTDRLAQGQSLAPPIDRDYQASCHLCELTPIFIHEKDDRTLLITLDW